MPITREERLARKMQHTKQERTQISQGVPSVSELRDGVSVIRSTPDGLVEYVRHKNALYRKVLDRADVARTTTTTVTKQDPILPIFQVYVGSTVSDMAADSEVDLQFNTVSIDTISGYTTSTYTYTVSVSGIYYLYYNITMSNFDSGMTAGQIQMKDNDGNYFAICRMDDKEYTADTGFVTRAAHAMRRLDVGQTVQVIVYQSGGHSTTDVKRNISSTTGAETIFGGYLLTPKTFKETTQVTEGGSTGSGSGGGLGGFQG
jgi:hypothetical protein